MNRPPYMGPARYKLLREAIAEAGYDYEIEWAETVEAPETPEDLWREYAWVVINSGMKNQVAVGIWERVRPAVEGGASASTVFGHKAKASAVDLFWEQRQSRFEEFDWDKGTQSMDYMLDWCEKLPWVGPITKYHLAKNLGVDCAKPDRWLERVAERSGETVEGLCQRLSQETGDRVATVDLVIWRACNLGLCKP